MKARTGVPRGLQVPRSLTGKCSPRGPSHARMQNQRRKKRGRRNRKNAPGESDLNLFASCCGEQNKTSTCKTGRGDQEMLKFPELSPCKGLEVICDQIQCPKHCPSPSLTAAATPREQGQGRTVAVERSSGQGYSSPAIPALHSSSAPGELVSLHTAKSTV